jgi:drug/metabolite transporter (DMT)-like permease
LKTRDGLDLFGLAAIWGASFLFMRAGASDFGPVALAFVRVAGAAAVLMPLVFWKGLWPDIRRHWRPIVVAGLASSAIPFLCFSYAALTVPAGVLAIFNATTPLFGSIIASLWLKDRLTPSRALGLAIGFGGVLYLVWSRAHPAAGGASALQLTALLACLVATLGYGLATNFSKRYVPDVPPIALAAGTQLASTAALVLPAWLWWPSAPISGQAWGAVLLLAVLCTGLAYVVFFRLIASAGPPTAMSVTFLIPLFAALWGWLLLNESLTRDMVLGCAIILLGTSLVTGMVKLPSWGTQTVS